MVASTTSPSRDAPVINGGLVALHGWEFPLPAGWDLAGTTGHERHGWMLLARERVPLVRLVWRRHPAAPDLERSLDKAGVEVRRRSGGQRLAVRSAPDPHQRLGEWDAPSGTWHVAVRTFPGTQLTLAITALAPGIPVGALLAAATARPLDAPWHWSAYGLEALLPAWWRLVGIQPYAGLVRALWHRRPDGRFRPDQMLMLRRHACATRLLAGQDPGSWLVAGLERQERVEVQDASDGAWSVIATRPAATWWRRIRGGCDRRILHAWIDEPADRLVLQEWRGAGDPLPCLRLPTAMAVA